MARPTLPSSPAYFSQENIDSHTLRGPFQIFSSLPTQPHAHSLQGGLTSQLTKKSKSKCRGGNSSSSRQQTKRLPPCAPSPTSCWSRGASLSFLLSRPVGEEAALLPAGSWPGRLLLTQIVWCHFHTLLFSSIENKQTFAPLDSHPSIPSVTTNSPPWSKRLEKLK